MSNGKPQKPRIPFVLPDSSLRLPGQPELSELDKALLEFDSYMNERLFQVATVMIQMLGYQAAQLEAMKEAIGVMPKPTAFQLATATKRVEDVVMKSFGFANPSEVDPN